MRHIYGIAFLLISGASWSDAQVVQTYAGGGPNNIPATSAAFGCPSRVVPGAQGTFYFADACTSRVYMVSITGTVTVVAGNGTAGYSGDGGPATAATLNSPYDVAIDGAGNVFIADTSNNRIRRVAASTGTISTVAGNGSGGYGGDGGPAINASFNGPIGLAIDAASDLIIADINNQRIRSVAASTGVITTVAGNGSCGYSGDGGPATSANLCNPYDVAVDGAGDLVIADYGYGHVRFVSAATGVISTVAGTGNCGYSGDGGPAVNACLNGPISVAVDSAGDIFIADYSNYRIRKVTGGTGIISTVAGNGNAGFGGDGGPAANAELYNPFGVGLDSSGDILIADYSNQRVRFVAAGTGYITTVAGGSISAGDGYPAISATLSSPTSMATDGSGNVIIADSGDSRVRRVNASTGIITTIAGNGTNGFSGDDGPATSASLSSPYGVAVDAAGNIYIVDQGNQRVRRVAASTGVITTVAGDGLPSYTGDGGPATSASLYNPYDVAVDLAGNIYIADANNHRIRRVNVSTGIITTVAGNGTPGYAGDGGPATSANLNYPQGIAIDAAGNLLIADTNNQRIRRVNAAGVISTVAGNGIAGFNSDSQAATTASLNSPDGIAVDSGGNLYIADTGNQRIRRVDATTGLITTVAGNGDYFFSGDGQPAVYANLANPVNVAINSAGNLYIADDSNQRIRIVTIGSALALSPSTVQFANETSGLTSSPQTVTLSNNSPTAIYVASITASGTFAIAGTTCGASLNAGANCQIMVTFTPLAAVAETGFLTVTANGVLYDAGLQGQGLVPGGTGTITGVTAGSGLTGGGTSGSVTLSVDSTVARTNASNTFTTNQTVNGTMNASSFSGNGANLTSLSPGNIAPGTAAISITGNAATATAAMTAYKAQTAGELGGVPAASYARQDIGNTFTGNQTVNGNLTVANSVSTTGPLAIGTGGTPITNYVSTTFQVTLPAITVGSCTKLTETLNAVGSGTNDTIALGVPNAFEAAGGSLLFQAWESAANTISIKVCNIAGTTTASVTGVLRVDLFKH